MTRNVIHQEGRNQERFRDFCDKRTLWGLAGLAFIYPLVTCAIPSKKMLWNDELFALYISKLDSLSDILAALSTEADQHPSSFYLLTVLSI